MEPPLVGIIDGVGFRCNEALKDHADIGASLLRRDSRFEPGNEAEPVEAPVRQPTLPANARSVAIGIVIEGVQPVSTPKNSGGVTPTMVKATLFRNTARPITD